MAVSGDEDDKRFSLAALMRHRAHQQFQSIRDGNGPLPIGVSEKRARPRLIQDVNPANQISAGTLMPLKVAHPLKYKKSASQLRSTEGLSTNRGINKRPSSSNLRASQHQGRDDMRRAPTTCNTDLSREHFNNRTAQMSNGTPNRPQSILIRTGTSEPSLTKVSKKSHAYSNQAKTSLQVPGQSVSSKESYATLSPRVKNCRNDEHRSPEMPIKTFRIKTIPMIKDTSANRRLNSPC